MNPTTEDHVDWRRELLDAGIDLFELPSRGLNTEDGQNLACDVSEDSISLWSNQFPRSSMKLLDSLL